MKNVTISSKKIYGQSVRTKNVDETNPATAKIGGLWQNFFAKTFAHLSPQAQTYGVYYDYHSDHAGEFSVLAGTDVPTEKTGDKLEEVTLIDGNYVVFTGTGEMPQAVIDLWGEVWRHFADPKCSDIRDYKTDFEHYKKSGTEVDIYISVE